MREPPIDRPLPAARLRPQDVLGAPPPSPEGGFTEITQESDGDADVLVHVREAVLTQWIALGASTAAFVLFVIIGLPAMRLTKMGTIVWMFVGILVLAGVGLATQARTRTTRIRIDAVGLQIEQGSAMDREHIELTWADVTGAELEPVNVKDPRKGMQLRITTRDADPVDTLPDVGVGDLMEVRRMLLARWQQPRTTPAA